MVSAGCNSGAVRDDVTDSVQLFTSDMACIMPTQEQMNRIIAERTQTFWQKFDADEQTAQPESADYYLPGLSKFVSRYLELHPDWLAQPSDDPDSLDYPALLQARLAEVNSEDDLHRALRQFRNAQMANLARRDLLNQQSIETSIIAMSDLADALILAARDWLYHHLSQRYGTPAGPHGPQSLLILGMGKLGGRELNFSSDIDLIFCYPTKGMTEGGRKQMENQQFFNKLAQKLIAALNTVTVDGQVFRVDMRLRPFGDSGPLVTHFAALEDYYQEQGRSWERFAMVKARVLGAESPYLAELKNILRPFTFRRYLDFTTIDALRHMKGLITREIRRRGLTDNIKLGPGGIREVEFFAQSFQLIHGGREPALQQRGLHETLTALADLDIVEAGTIHTLYDHYQFLRKVEHTLQQFDDAQTQTLPDDEHQQAVLCQVMEFADYEAFYAELSQRMEEVHAQFNDLVEEHHQSHSSEDSLYLVCKDAWQLDMNQDDFGLLLAPYVDDHNAEAVYEQLNGFRASLRQFRIGERGQKTLDELMPELLHTLLEQCPTDAHTVMPRLLNVIRAITGRTTYLNLLLENLEVLKQLVHLCQRSDWIARQIQRFPLLLDELLTPLYLQQQNSGLEESRAEYTDELRQQLLRIDPDDVEQTMEACRQFKLCQQLRIAASDISGSLPVTRVSDKLTVLAEVLLESVISQAWGQVSARFGEPEHLQDNQRGFAVIGYGKLGGYELGYGSDLDLVFVHNAPDGSHTNGKKAVGAQQFYIKLAQRIMHLLNTTTLFGQLYETDLRLRPSGSAGLLCCHIDGFESYQRQQAWTWEHQALVRARGVAGDPALLESFVAIRNAILQAERDASSLAEEVVTMREKMRSHLNNSKQQDVDLKHCVGGITDIEFLTQYWVLAGAHDHCVLTRYTDNLRILEQASALAIIDDGTSRTLANAYLSLRNQYHHLTLADDKLAVSNEALEQLRDKVSAIWQQTLAKQTEQASKPD